MLRDEPTGRTIVQGNRVQIGQRTLYRSCDDYTGSPPCGHPACSVISGHTGGDDQPRTRCSSIVWTWATSRSTWRKVLENITRLPLASATSSIPRIKSR